MESTEVFEIELKHAGRSVLLIPKGTFNNQTPFTTIFDEEGLSIHVYVYQVHFGFVHKDHKKGDW